jgi:excisionase family DNA binding protein
MTDDVLAGVARIHEGIVRVWEILAYLEADRYMTKRTAAAYIDHSDRIIEAAIRTGQLRAFRIGKKVLLRKSDIDAWILAGEVTRENRGVGKSDLRKLMDRAIETAKAKRGGLK